MIRYAQMLGVGGVFVLIGLVLVTRAHNASLSRQLAFSESAHAVTSDSLETVLLTLAQQAEDMEERARLTENLQARLISERNKRAASDAALRDALTKESDDGTEFGKCLSTTIPADVLRNLPE